MGIDPLGTPDIDKKQVQTGVHALLEYNKKANKDTFLDEAQRIDLQLGFLKVPRLKNKIVKVGLPHSLSHATTDVCLFVKDLNAKSRDYSPAVEHFEELLAKHGVTTITKVIPLKSLKLDYQPFEAKRNLSNMFDVFLADDCIMRLLPDFLGKNFYGRKRYPLQVNLAAKDLKKEINKALNISQCIITGRGSSCQISIGHTMMKEDQILANIATAFEKIVAAIPGGAVNVRNLHIKVGDSPGIPIYYNESSPNDVILPARPKRKDLDEPEDISVIDGAKVRVTPYGKIQFFPEDGSAPEKKKKKQSGAQKKKKRQQYPKKAAKNMGTTKTENKKTPAKQAKSNSVSKVTTSTPISAAEVVEMDSPAINETPKISPKKSKKLNASQKKEKDVKSPKQSPAAGITKSAEKTSPKKAGKVTTPKNTRLGKRKLSV